MIINLILFYVEGLANSDDNKPILFYIEGLANSDDNKPILFYIEGLANSDDNKLDLVLHRRSCKF